MADSYIIWENCRNLGLFLLCCESGEKGLFRG